MPANVVAVSVDPPAKSEALRVHLSLPFPILCDTEHRVVRDWDIYNAQERGGIAIPAVFLIDPGRVIRFASVDGVVSRVPATQIVSLLQSIPNAPPVRRTLHIPRISHWLGAVRNILHR